MMTNNPNPMDEKLRAALRMPQPRPEFIDNLRRQLMAETYQPISLWARIQSTFRRPVWAFYTATFILILGVFLLAGPRNVLAAVRGLFGYIPGFGLVRSDEPIRVLVAPVSQMREGVTVTVKQAILTKEKTSIVFSQKGLSASAILEYDGKNYEKLCSPRVGLIFPDGTTLSSQDSGSMGYDADQAAQYVNYFPAIPVTQREAVLSLTCLSGTGKGLAPEDWRIPLQLKDASSKDTQVLVIGVTPSVSSTASTPVLSNPLVLERVVESADGFIFMGHFNALRANSVLNTSHAQGPYITDHSGSHIAYTIPGDLLEENSPAGGFQWAYAIHQKDITWPITLHLDAVSVMCQQTGFMMAMDTGPNPQEGEKWMVNKTFDDSVCGFQVTSLARTSKGYAFLVTSPGNRVQQVSPEIEGNTTLESENVREYNDYFVDALEYARKEDVPTGQFNIAFPWVSVEVAGPWSVQWQPLSHK